MNSIAYNCNGLDPACSGKVGCFKCLLPPLDEAIVCHHTLKPEYALNGSCDDPETGVENGRFIRYLDGNMNHYYFEVFPTKKTIEEE